MATATGLVHIDRSKQGCSTQQNGGKYRGKFELLTDEEDGNLGHVTRQTRLDDTRVKRVHDDVHVLFLKSKLLS